MRFYQETINWTALLDSVDQMFPITKPVSTPNPAPITDFAEVERRARQIIPRRLQQRRFSEDVITWLGDPQNYCNESGGGLELRNAASDCVGKFVPRVSYVSFL